MAKRFTVTVSELRGGTGREWSVKVLAESEGAAVPRAIVKRFGKKAFWNADSSWSPETGQVFVTNPNAGNGWSASARTGRARVDVDAGW